MSNKENLYIDRDDALLSISSSTFATLRNTTLISPWNLIDMELVPLVHFYPIHYNTLRYSQDKKYIIVVSDINEKAVFKKCYYEEALLINQGMINFLLFIANLLE